MLWGVLVMFLMYISWLFSGLFFLRSSGINLSQSSEWTIVISVISILLVAGLIHSFSSIGEIYSMRILDSMFLMADVALTIETVFLLINRIRFFYPIF